MTTIKMAVTGAPHQRDIDARSSDTKTKKSVFAFITERMNAQPVTKNRHRKPRLSDARRHQILTEINTGYAMLQGDPEAWQEYQTELTAWDRTLADGLEEE